MERVIYWWLAGMAALVLTAAAGSAAQARGMDPLPIAQGFWIEPPEQCGTATSAYVYDGDRWGNFGYNDRLSAKPDAYINPITKVTRLRDGFTDIKTPEADGLSYDRIKSLGLDRAVLRTGLAGRADFEVWDTQLRHCGFAQLSPRMQSIARTLTPKLVPTEVAPTRDMTTTQPASAWTVGHSNSGTAFANAPASIAGIDMFSFGCSSGRVAMLVEVSGQHATGLAIDIATADGTAQANLKFDAQTGIYVGAVIDPNLLRFLTGTSSVADIAIDSRPMGKLSLSGSSAAIRTALAGCWQPAPKTPPAQATVAPTGPLGIAPGYYVDVAVACSAASDLFFYDGVRIGLPDYDDDANLRGLRVVPIGPVTKSRSGSLLIGSEAIELRKLSGGRIELTIQDTGPPLRLCRRDDVPAVLRAR